MTDSVLALKGIAKSYPGFRMGPVDIQIDRGYMVAVVGPNGSGKSTLFRMLMGLVSPDDGELRVFDRRVGDDIALTSRIGYVPERALGHDQMSVLSLSVFYERWYAGFDRDRFDAAINAMDVGWNKPFGKLSKGMQRRVSFALAMASDPELLLLDELTDGVDPFARREMIADISRLMESGERTVVFATHNMEEVRRLADYVVFLVNGQCLGMYEKDALLQGWRRAWLEGRPDADTPGIVSATDDRPVEIVSSWWEETARSLLAQNIVVERTAPIDLTEILEHVMTGMNNGGRAHAWPVAGETRSLRMP